MKHNLLKSVILSLILVMGVSNAWAKRYYFEVPNIPEWKGEKALYAVRLCKGAGINTGTGWERLTQWDENTYYMDFISNTYTHFQFCRMKDNITSLEGSSWMNLVHTSCYTMPSPIPTDNDEPNLLTVGSRGDDDNSNETQTYSAVWDYQTFTVENVHIIFEVGGDFWRNAPKLLIGDKTSSQTFEVNPIENSSTIYHYHIDGPITYTGYTFIQPAEAEETSDETPFHTRCTQIDNQIYTWNSGWYPDNESQEDKLTKYDFTSFDSKSYQQIILDKDNDEMSYRMYRDIVYYIKTRTRSYYEPITDNVFHKYNPGDEVDSKTYFDDIEDLNKTLTIEVKVSYDDGQTYEQTGTLPLTFLSEYFPKRDIGGVFWYFTDDWDRMSESNTFNLPKGGKTFSYTIPMGYKARNVNIAYKDLDLNKYVIDKWIINNTPTPDSQDHNKFYQHGHFEEENPVITLLIKKIENWTCTVTFNTEALNNNDIQINQLEVEPNTKIAAPIISPELHPVGYICKWYTKEGVEFDFDTHITQDYELYGRWVREAEEGDYRLLYVEQVVEKSTQKEGDEWKTVITRKKAHPSDIIKPSDLTDGESKIVSLHVYNKNTYQAVKNPKATNNEDKYYDSPSNSEVILQRYNGTIWEDKERHMVFGPMETLPAMAMLPGRRNAEGNAILKYDEGIPAIQTDEKYNGNGVWNFPIIQSGNGDATLDREYIERYEGTYYIRTANAEGGWNNYTIPANHMTFSEYQATLGLRNEEFTHYFCKWVDLEKLDSKFVHYVVANDFAQAVSDTLIADRTDLFGKPLEANQQIVGNDAVLPTSANIRFSWREENNALHRAYLAPSVSDRFLVLEANDPPGIFDPTSGNNLAISGLEANEQIFTYDSKWIYHADIQMQPRADIQVTAKYNNITQYFIGDKVGDQETFRNTVLQGSGTEKYLVRLLYDFKNNEIISAYVPGASPDVYDISTNLMLIRQNNNEATQLIFNNETRRDMEQIPTNRRAYGVIEFTEKRLIQGKDDKNKSLNDYEKSLYWISFPFDVDVSKAISFGEYGKHWIIQEYNGARRAAEGMWLDSETFWDYKWNQNITLEAGKGYVLALDVDQIASDRLFDLSGNRPIGIYFPSTEYISTAITEQAEVSTIVPAHVCTIKRETQKGDRRIADSHWNVIGVPSYRNTTGTYQFANIETKPTEVKYYYRWDGNFNAYTAMETTSLQDFQSTYAYMVQFAGQINWTNIFNVSGGAPQALAARQSTDAEKEHRLRLELHQKGNKADHTFVRLQDEDGVTDHFDFNHDLCKVINAGANIYSVITAEESPVEVAANVMPIAETIIPLGVKITAAGEYTFAMPDGTDGIVVELIDYETNTRTNMLLDNYTVNLGKGTFDNRFALHVKPDKTTTSVDNIGNEAIGDKVKKYLIDGVLYMQKDGVLYDAQGKLVR